MSTSQISVFYKAFIKRVEAVFSPDDGWTRLANPYRLTANADIMMAKGWGVKLGGSTKTSFMCSNMMTDRTFTVVICREVMKTELDAEAIAGVELQLMEDVRAVVKDFETTSTLNNGQGNVGFTEDGGVDLVGGEEGYLSVEVNFTVKIVENLNS